MFTLTIDHSIPPDWHSVVVQTVIRTKSQQTMTASPEMAVSYHYVPGNALTTAERHNCIEALGWSKADALETLLRLRTFAEDWEEPGMEAYDDL